MHLDHFRPLLMKRAQEAGLSVEVGGEASEDELEAAERRLGLQLPREVRLFYRACNGLHVPRPALTILSLEKLAVSEGRIHFATFAERHPLGFDVTALNSAGQWSVVSMETGAVVTLTMASFWSNKLWAWLFQGREIWRPDAVPAL